MKLLSLVKMICANEGGGSSKEVNYAHQKSKPLEGPIELSNIK